MMASLPRVSFMIATHNRVAELVTTIETCIQPSNLNTEILVVDACSTDGTFEAMAERYPRVAITRNKVNRGSIASRNDILRRAKGDYIIPLDGGNVHATNLNHHTCL